MTMTPTTMMKVGSYQIVMRARRNLPVTTRVLLVVATPLNITLYAPNALIMYPPVLELS